VNIAFRVRLPVDAQSVPLVRGLLRQALDHLGVAAAGVEDILLALTEACANVVQHAGDHDEYEVDIAIDDTVCRISVLDDGDGFDAEAVADAQPGSPLEGGRGLLLMRALVDHLAFREAADGRHGVFLEKQLVTSPRLRLLPT
jgi:anti-sigma regulatory factor (Ser/Thr protein kinase)